MMQQVKAPTQACFWLIGAENNSQPPAVAVDLHYADGELAAETWTRELRRGEGVDAAQAIALAYAGQYGVTDLTYDDDSTAFFADC